MQSYNYWVCLSPKALQQFRDMRRTSEDSYGQFYKLLKMCRITILKTKVLLNDDVLREQFRILLPTEIGVFYDQRNVVTATKMAELADLYR